MLRPPQAPPARMYITPYKLRSSAPIASDRKGQTPRLLMSSPPPSPTPSTPVLSAGTPSTASTSASVATPLDGSVKSDRDTVISASSEPPFRIPSGMLRELTSLVAGCYPFQPSYNVVTIKEEIVVKGKRETETREKNVTAIKLLPFQHMTEDQAAALKLQMFGHDLSVTTFSDQLLMPSDAEVGLFRVLPTEHPGQPWHQIDSWRTGRASSSKFMPTTYLAIKDKAGNFTFFSQDPNVPYDATKGQMGKVLAQTTLGAPVSMTAIKRDVRYVGLPDDHYAEKALRVSESHSARKPAGWWLTMEEMKALNLAGCGTSYGELSFTFANGGLDPFPEAVNNLIRGENTHLGDGYLKESEELAIAQLTQSTLRHDLYRLSDLTPRKGSIGDSPRSVIGVFTRTSVIKPYIGVNTESESKGTSWMALVAGGHALAWESDGTGLVPEL